MRWAGAPRAKLGSFVKKRSFRAALLLGLARTPTSHVREQQALRRLAAIRTDVAMGLSIRSRGNGGGRAGGPPAIGMNRLTPEAFRRTELSEGTRPRRAGRVALAFVDDEARDGVEERLGLVGAHGVAAVLEDAQLRARHQARDLLGEFRRADPIVPAGDHQRRRGDPAELRPQIE